MQVITLDFETFWDRRDYTLTKMQMSAYVRDPRYKTHMIGIKVDDGSTVVYSHEEFKEGIPELRFEENAVLCQNSPFDSLILSHHYDVHPKLILDTLSMSRALHPHWKHHSLKAICKHYGLKAKGTEVENTSGKVHLTQAEYDRLAEYCIDDVDTTYQAFRIMAKGFPLSELRLISLIIKMFTEPVLQFNKRLLLEEYKYETERKADLLEKSGAGKSILSSNDKFAALLESLGVDPPRKLSPAALKKGEEKETWAFAKSDEGFKAVLEHDNVNVRVVCAARLGVKSAINETRALRFLRMSQLGPVPIGLSYYAAHTGRLGGNDKTNFQNLQRGGRIRRAIEAPDGYVVVVGDLGQIEARALAALAREKKLLDGFKASDLAEGETDVYTEMASKIFQRRITKKDKLERQIGKATILGGGYGLGFIKFSDMQRVGMLGAPPNIFGEEMAAMLDVDVAWFKSRYREEIDKSLPPGWENRKKEHIVHCACSQGIIGAYRQDNAAIVRSWEAGNEALAYCLNGDPFTFCEVPQIEVGKGFMLLPNRMKLLYPGLSVAQTRRGPQYSYEGKKHRVPIWGGSLMENVTQAVARIIMTDAMLTINKRYRVVLTVHDEIVCCVPEDQGDECFAHMKEVMCTPPKWAPDLPLAVDGGWAKNYSK